MKKPTSEFYSIFGEIEAFVANAMTVQGICHRIEYESIPPTARFNQFGERARFAIMIPSIMVPEFEKRVANLRA